MDKLDALSQFASFGKKREQAIAVIVNTADDQGAIYTLTKATFCNVLERVISNEIDIDELELWASVLESRQDIDESAVEGAIFALSNAEQMGELNKETLITLLALIK